MSAERPEFPPSRLAPPGANALPGRPNEPANLVDILGTYEVRLDGQGTLRGYKRVGRFMRGDAGERQ